MSNSSNSKKKDWPEIPGYELEALIGRGGMGRVFRARDRKLGRLVAIKCMLQSGDEQLSRRFEEEARAAAQLQHPNIAQLYEFNWESEQKYFVMEYLAGGTLADLLNGRPVEPALAARVVAVLASAMSHAHDLDIVHRDLKPGNILIAVGTSQQRSNQNSGLPSTTSIGADSPDRSDSSDRLRQLDPDFDTSRLRVADFGLARHLADQERLTKTGEVLGTPEYMSPEQATGINARVGKSSDIYSLGAILYEMLTGRPPFVGPDSLQTVMMLLSQEPIPPRSIVTRTPLDIQTICLKCLEKKATRRYVSTKELADDLIRFSCGEPIKARPVSALTRAAKWAARRPWQASVIGLLGLLAAGATVGLILLQNANQTIRITNLDLTKSNEELIKANNLAEESFQLSQKGLNGIVIEIRNRLFDLPGANQLNLEVTRQTTDLARKLWKLRPEEKNTVRELVQAIEIQRQLEWQSGNRDESTALLNEQKSLLDGFCQRFPDDLKLALAQLRTWMDLADAQIGSEKQELDAQISKRIDELLVSFQGAPQLFQIASMQKNRELNEAVAAQRVTDVLPLATQIVEYSRKFANGDAENEGSQYWLVQSLVRLTKYQLLTKDGATASGTIKEARQVLQKLSFSRTFRDYSAAISEQEAELAIFQEQWEDAEGHLNEAVSAYRQLLNEYSEDLIRTSLSSVLLRSAMVAQRSGKGSVAETYLKQADGLVNELLQHQPDDWLSNDLARRIREMRAEISLVPGPEKTDDE